MTKKHSRREFVSGMAALAAGAILAACGDNTATIAPAPSPTKAATTAAATAAQTTEAAKAAAKAAHWTYEGAEGPEAWGELDPTYAVCSVGKNQTPIDLPLNGKESPLKKVERSYNPTAVNYLNNGHTIQVDYDKGSSLTIDGKKYDLAQFHFHSPSEHKFAGQAFPMELHLVHKAADNSLAVVGIMMSEGAENTFLTKFWDKMPTKEGKESLSITINVSDTVPTEPGYYTYEGSLTTPGCTEGVRWIVLKKPVTISKAQVDKFVSVIGHNARPVQPTNNRDIGVGI